MASPFVAEIRIFPFNFAPKGWAFCDGQILSISQNTALFSLLGTNYGGNGTSNFALPNLQGSVAIHTTQYANSPLGQFSLGQTGGEASVTVLTSQIPSHTHNVQAEAYFKNAVAASPAGAVPAAPTPLLIYSNAATPTKANMSPLMVAVAGSTTPHNNLMPYLVMNFCIALQGIFPPRS